MRSFHLLLMTSVLCLGCRPRCADAPLSIVCERCNLVIISLTGVRKDHVGLYGYHRDTTPNIDRFFAEAFRFERAKAPASWTVPVAASLVTGQFPYTHRVMHRHGQRLSDDRTTLAEVLRERGYDTAAFTAGGDWAGELNLHQGFVLADAGRGRSFGNVVEPVSRATDWLSSTRRPFFLLVQGFDAHCPYQPSLPFDRFDPGYDGQIDFSRCFWSGRKSRRQASLTVRARNGRQVEEVALSERDHRRLVALYDGTIAEADARLAPLFSELESKGERTIVVFMSEHGELLGEHGVFMRTGSLRGTFYAPVLSFPLLVRLPNRRGAAIGGLTQTVDLLPTLLALLGVRDSGATEREGQNLMALFANREMRINRHAFAGSRYHGCDPFFAGTSVVEAVESDEWKLVVEQEHGADGVAKPPWRELFAIQRDPDEQQNLASAEPGRVAELEQLLRTKFGPLEPAAACPENQ